MKRDIEIIRLLLLQQETDEDPLELDEYDPLLVVYNIVLMKDAGLIEASIVENEKGEPVDAVVMRLTWDGHDFLDATKNPDIWTKAKDKLIKPGVSWSFSILKEYLKQEAKNQMGMS